jgi:hypothetical protein
MKTFNPTEHKIRVFNHKSRVQCPKCHAFECSRMNGLPFARACRIHYLCGNCMLEFTKPRINK